MADYEVVESGTKAYSSPGTTTANNGCIGVYYELRKYSSEYKFYWEMRGWFGVVIGSTVKLCYSSSGGYCRFYETTDNYLYNPTLRSYSYATTAPYFGNNNPANTWYALKPGTYNSDVATSGEFTVSSGEHTFTLKTYRTRLHYSTTYYKSDTSTRTTTFTVTVPDLGRNVVITYGDAEIVNETVTDVEIVYNGETVATDTATLKCAGKVMATDVTAAGKTLKCAGMLMEHDLAVTVT